MRAGHLHAIGLPISLLMGLLLTVLAGCSRSDTWWDSYSGNRNYDSSYSGDSSYYSQQNSAPARPQPRPISHEGGTYVVRDGDTLYKVSREQNVPIRALIDANNLEPPYSLLRGQRLVIPRSRYHVVQKGDTVYSISRTYGVDMATLMSANNITPPYKIRLGERLQLPAKVNTQVTSYEPRTTQKNVPLSRPGETYTTTPNTVIVGTQPKTPIPAPPTSAGGFSWPVQGKIIMPFGSQEGGLHNDGVNIAVPNGTPVHASQNGVVAYAGNELKGYGNLLLVRHANGWMTAYAHNSKLLVNRGDTVVKGQQIAASGRSGSVTSPQVHFEVRKGAKAVDPRSIIGG